MASIIPIISFIVTILVVFWPCPDPFGLKERKHRAI
ncbi:hypothetical protein IYQ_20441 [Aeromonas salmonicida subsp. salmonicida 01-B526]|uniref:Uncharacterized protein n=1 Tax=Aeromonas salmonicida subsp. salmonicida 01-B526 TaxID=1076135 RepID=A0ABN0DVW4_AERSS|nr:hypothetical protein IYQ_20441 [Aeromonas salmonicida subsp. salmonicida 01-B526]